MAILLNLIIIVAGIALVLWGADRLTEGAAGIARRMSVPEIVIGLTIVAAGTSAPELFVSLVSALKGTPDMAVGNVVGSNIFNSLLIVGTAAVVTPMVITPATAKKDIPCAVAASLLLALLMMDDFTSLSISGNMLGRFDGIVMLAGFVFFMIYTFKVAGSNKGEKATADAESAADDGNSSEDAAPQMSIPKGALWILVGLACLIIGSNLFVDNATAMATTLGVSQSVIGLTIVAGGTSLPELATSVVAARKGQSAIAIGNVIGSTVFNVLLILGTTAVICPMQIGGITLVDVTTSLLAAALLWLFSFTKFKLERWEGAVLLVVFTAYMAWLLHNL